LLSKTLVLFPGACLRTTVYIVFWQKVKNYSMVNQFQNANFTVRV